MTPARVMVHNSVAKLNERQKHAGVAIMVRVASLFSQLLEQVPRSRFAGIVARHGGERAAKGFTCWDQFVAMLFCHLAQADSLRTICGGLALCLGKLVHLGLRGAPRRSTLSYANAHRPAAIYEDLFWAMLEHFRQRRMLGSTRHFRFKNKLLLLDSTTISLCLSLFDWASFRRAKGGVKLHVLLDHDDYMPQWVLLSEARRHDRKAASLLSLKAGSIVAMDRAYNDYSLFDTWCERGIFFVTRMKDNAQWVLIRALDPPQGSRILSDGLIEWYEPLARQKCPRTLRRIVVWDPVEEREIVLLTNHLEFGATTIAAIYKERWQIELFFKALKQLLRIKTFVGTSENALRIQIWTALIAILLFKWLHFISKAKWSLTILAAMLRMSLFTYRDLRQWLDSPFGAPPWTPEEGPFQLELPLFGQQRLAARGT